MMRALLAAVPLLLAASPPVPVKVMLTDQDYPEAAREAGVEGDVGFDVLIDAKGKVTGCELTKGADVPERLAADSCAITARWRFAPARDDAGKAVPGRVSYAIAWRIALPCPPRDGVTLCVRL